MEINKGGNWSFAKLTFVLSVLSEGRILQKKNVINIDQLLCCVTCPTAYGIFIYIPLKESLC